MNGFIIAQGPLDTGLQYGALGLLGVVLLGLFLLLVKFLPKVLDRWKAHTEAQINLANVISTVNDTVHDWKQSFDQKASDSSARHAEIMAVMSRQTAILDQQNAMLQAVLTHHGNERGRS